MRFEGKAYFWLTTGGAVTLLLLFLAWGPDNSARWAAMTDRIGELKIAAKTRKTRSVLRGEARPGNAWEEYDLALNDTLTWGDDQNGVLYVRFANGDSSVDREKVKRMVADHIKVLVHLHLGAQRSDGQYWYDWDNGIQMEIPSLLGSRRLANFAVAQASILMETGRTQEAADLLLDVTVFGKDLSSNGPLFSSLLGVAIYQIAFDELRLLILSGKLTPKQLAALATKLETVDRDFPTLGSTLANETLGLHMTVLEMSRKFRARKQYGGWQFVVFPNATALDAFEQSDAFYQRFEKADQLTFKEAKKEIDGIAAEAAASPNKLVQSSGPSVSRVMETHYEALARLRLLRAAAVYLATGEVPTLADPFGTNLLSTPERATLKIWSLGRDGENQNGTGDWGKSPDLVVDIPKQDGL